jgi:hypothetical protein
VPSTQEFSPHCRVLSARLLRTSVDGLSGAAELQEAPKVCRATMPLGDSGNGSGVPLVKDIKRPREKRAAQEDEVSPPPILPPGTIAASGHPSRTLYLVGSCARSFDSVCKRLLIWAFQGWFLGRALFRVRCVVGKFVYFWP